MNDPFSSALEHQESGLLTQQGQEQFRVTFNKSGTFRYCCNIITRMSGVVEVVERLADMFMPFQSIDNSSMASFKDDRYQPNFPT